LLSPLLLAALLTAIPFTAFADIASAVNDARLHDCPSSAGLLRLRGSTRLNDAARRLSYGDSLDKATRQSGYRTVTATALQVTNVPGDRDVERLVAMRFCSQLTQRDLREIGTFRRGPDVWLLLAAPFVPPPPRDWAAISSRVLELTNEARAHARRCGSATFPAAPPLTLGPPTLEQAALEHSQDMANHSYMDHTGRDGTSPGDRVSRAGYKWKTIGENLASGILTPEEVVKGWVGSPHHCENLMTAQFTQMVVAYAANSTSSGGIYWTQLFGTPR
jgi:uncharacterized protein YkwD